MIQLQIQLQRLPLHLRFNLYLKRKCLKIMRNKQILFDNRMTESVKQNDSHDHFATVMGNDTLPTILLSAINLELSLSIIYMVLVLGSGIVAFAKPIQLEMYMWWATSTNNVIRRDLSWPICVSAFNMGTASFTSEHYSYHYTYSSIMACIINI